MPDEPTPFLDFEHPFDLEDDSDDGQISPRNIWAMFKRLENQNTQLIKGLQMVDQSLSDLQAADSALGTAVTNESNEINAATLGIQSLLSQLVAASGNNDSAAVEALAQDINSQVSKINDSTANLGTVVASIPSPSTSTSISSSVSAVSTSVSSSVSAASTSVSSSLSAVSTSVSSSVSA